MTTYALVVHDDSCPTSSTFYEVRRGGYAWLACRRCSATAVRRIPIKETTP